MRYPLSKRRVSLFLLTETRWSACRSLVRNGHPSILSTLASSSLFSVFLAYWAVSRVQREEETKPEMTINRLSHHLRERQRE